MKLERLISIIMLLNNCGRMSAGALAEKYEVSVKTIRRDIETINQAGIPIVAYQGQDGGYEIMKNYKLDRSVLTQRESNLLIALVKGLEKVYPCFDFANLREKFGAVHEEKAETARLMVDFSGWGPNGKTEEKLKLIGQALSKQKVLSFQYRNLHNEQLMRCVEPFQIVFRGVQWYLFGWCRMRQDYRFFKVKRMRDLAVTADSYQMRDVRVEDLSIAPFKAPPGMIKLRVSDLFLRKIDDYFETFMLEGNVVSLDWPCDEWACNFILGLGEDVEVLEPPTLREKLKQKIIAMAGLYHCDEIK